MLRFEPSEHDPPYIRVWRESRLLAEFIVAGDSSDETEIIFESRLCRVTLAELRAITDKITELDRETGK